MVSSPKGRGAPAPQQRITASYSASSRFATAPSEASTPQTKVTPSSVIRSMRRRTTDLGSFILGMPYISRPPGCSARSMTVTMWPRRFSWSAAARPAGPEPTTQTFFPDHWGGRRGRSFPAPKAASMMLNSLSRTVMGSP